jgi:acyl dehydratase
MTKAAGLSLSEIKVGLTVSFPVVLTPQKVKSFLNLSGDFNPLHADQVYAKTTRFGAIVVPGMLLASFFSQLVGMHLPGKKALYMSQTLQFKQPGFIDDEVVVKGEVTSISHKLSLIVMKTTITRIKDKTLLVAGEAKVMYLG